MRRTLSSSAESLSALWATLRGATRSTAVAKGDAVFSLGCCECQPDGTLPVPGGLRSATLRALVRNALVPGRQSYLG